MMDAKEIIKKYLKENKFDGLANRDGECGCGLDDLGPCCNDDILNCEPAKFQLCTNCKTKDECESEAKGDESAAGCYFIPE
jgi:hypothetical protein